MQRFVHPSLSPRGTEDDVSEGYGGQNTVKWLCLLAPIVRLFLSRTIRIIRGEKSVLIVSGVRF